LHEALILSIEYIIHQVIFEQSTHPYTTHQQADIANGQCEDIERSCTDFTDGQCKQPPVEEEKDEAGEKHRPNLWPRDFLFLYALCPKTGQGKKHYTKEFRPKDGREQSRGALEVHQYLVDDTEREVPLLKRFVAEPITVDKEEYHRYTPHKVHDLAQCP